MKALHLSLPISLLSNLLVNITKISTLFTHLNICLSNKTWIAFMIHILPVCVPWKIKPTSTLPLPCRTWFIYFDIDIQAVSNLNVIIPYYSCGNSHGNLDNLQNYFWGELMRKTTGLEVSNDLLLSV